MVDFTVVDEANNRRINVTDPAYGADPTGVADSNAGFVLAKAEYDSFPANEKPFVYIPPGKYLNSARVNWEAAQVRGGGIDNTIITPTHTDGEFTFVFDNNKYECTGMTFQTSATSTSLIGATAGTTGFCGGVQAGVFDGGDVQVQAMNGSTDTVESTNHPFRDDDRVQFEGLSLPAEIVVGTSYFVINSVAGVSFQVSATRGGGLHAFSSGGSALRVFQAAPRGKLDVKCIGLFVGAAGSGWLTQNKVNSSECDTGWKFSDQNGSVLDLRTERSNIYGELKRCGGANTLSLYGTGSNGLLSDGTVAISGMLGATFGAVYFEETPGSLRATPAFTFGSSDDTGSYGLTLGGIKGQNTGMSLGVNTMIIDFQAGGSASGMISATSENVNQVLIGSNNVCFDPAGLVPRGSPTSPFKLQSSFEMLPDYLSSTVNPLALNPLPYFEHRGGQFSRQQDTRAATNWLESTRMPGTWKWEIIDSAAGGTNSSYGRVDFDGDIVDSLNGKFFMAVAIIHIPDTAANQSAYGTATADLNSTAYKPSLQIIARNAAFGTLITGTQIDLGAQQKHRIGTVQAYASFIDASSETLMTSISFQAFRVANSADLTLHTGATIEVEAVFLYEVPNITEISALIPHSFRTDIQTLDKTSVFEAGRLRTSQDVYASSNNKTEYVLGDRIELTPTAGGPDYKVCTTAGTGTAAVFKDSANLAS